MAAKKESKGKKKVKNKRPSERWKKYKNEGGKLVSDKTCPKCGPCMFLGKHKDRLNCGKCGYTEFIKK